MVKLNRTLIHRAGSIVAIGILTYISTPIVGAAEQTIAGDRAKARKAAFIPPANVTPLRPSLDGMARTAPAGEETVLVFSAPPRESAEDGIRTYQPIADYLSRVIGKKIVYRQPSDWLSYQAEMQKGSYDLVFDGPHFNSWRISNLRHSALVKIADEHTFAVVVSKDNSRITDVKQLAGQKMCGMTSPDLGTLAVLAQFDNPMRQPLIINSVSWKKIYEAVAFDKKCAAGILPLANLKKFPNSEDFIRVVYQTRPHPNQAFSAGPRISRDDQARIAASLVSPAANAVMGHLMATYGADKGLAYANTDEYTGLDIYLKDTWGYTR